MKPNYQNLGSILYSQNQYVTPVFQRYYRWERPQWEKLWENLLELRQPVKTGQHFMGFLVFVASTPQPGRITTFYLIDGQQRLTTLSLFLIALRDVASANGYKELSQEISDSYLLHPHKKASERFRLFLKDRDRDEYLAAVEGKPANGRVGAALDFFKQQISGDHPNATDTEIRGLLELVTLRLEFMCATLEHDSAYNIFKSLNSTGVPLGASDLIRNFVFMHVPPDDQDEFDTQLWSPLEMRFTTNGTLDGDDLSRFMREFLMRDGRYVRPPDTFDAFEERYEATGFSPNALTADLNAYAAYYEVIRSKKTDTTSEVTQALVRLNALDSSTTYPLLLTLFARRAQKQIGDADLALGIQLLSGFILRRFVCGDGSRGYGRLFVSACGSLGKNPVDGLRVFLESRGFPDRQRFKNAFVWLNLYQSRYAHFVLACLEEAQGHREPADLSQTQIEHIMPQTLSGQWKSDLGSEADRIYSTWLHTPGNLTLSAYNLELWNDPFSVKKLEYAKSNVVMNRELAKLSAWGETQIQERAQTLATLAAAIWIGPDKPVEVSQVAESEDDDGTIDVAELTEGEQVRLKYWADLIAYLKSSGGILQCKEPTYKTWLRSDCPIHGFRCGFEIAVRDKWIDVYVSTSNEGHVNTLSDIRNSQMDAFERELGEETDWMETPKKDRNWVCISLEADPLDTRDWPRQHEWMKNKLEKLVASIQKYLTPRSGT